MIPERLPSCLAAVPPPSAGFTEYYIVGDDDGAISIQQLQTALPGIIARNLGLPSDYPLDFITITLSLRGGSARHLLAATLLISFTLKPSPLLPPLAQLQARFESSSTTIGVASDLAVQVPSLGGTSSSIARSSSSGALEEPPKRVTGEACTPLVVQ